MKVKVGDRIYDGNTVPIMVILSEEDKKRIADMDLDHTKYAQFPDDMGPSDILVWMRAC